MKPPLARFLLLAAALLSGLGLQAHEIRPAYFEITENAAREVHVLWKQPAVGDRTLAIRPVLSSGWLKDTYSSTITTDVYIIRTWDIPQPHGPIAGQTLRIEGLDRTMTDVLVHISFANGQDATQMVTAAHPVLVIPTPGKASLPVAAYLNLGVAHIWSGIDHLLYVLGLILLTENIKTLFKTISAFTVTHSVTLAASVLQIIHVPPAPVEAVIALSVLYIAVELVHLRRGRAGLAHRYPWLVAFTFGLLHGVGFAGALAQAGLPAHKIPLALLLFNLGIEAGQLGFVVVVLLAGYALKCLAPSVITRFQWVPPYAIGGAASFWFIQRTLAFL
jgi:hydrogenase/urease accessory protein HupE